MGLRLTVGVEQVFLIGETKVQVLRLRPSSRQVELLIEAPPHVVLRRPDRWPVDAKSNPDQVRANS